MRYLIFAVLAVAFVFWAMSLGGCAPSSAPSNYPPADQFKQRYGLSDFIIQTEVSDRGGCPLSGTYNQYGYNVALKTTDNRVMTGIVCHISGSTTWNLYLNGDTVFLNR